MQSTPAISFVSDLPSSEREMGVLLEAEALRLPTLVSLSFGHKLLGGGFAEDPEAADSDLLLLVPLV
ncbi:hypothetical protein Tco_1351779 [Tanacetum coccineum]|uniref:Uncharacterized protein n=1 Tax=Tanacetum coccineum TaxID=301880 RepID=A0ABQ5H6L4_9ASTR